MEITFLFHPEYHSQLQNIEKLIDFLNLKIMVFAAFNCKYSQKFVFKV